MLLPKVWFFLLHLRFSTSWADAWGESSENTDNDQQLAISMLAYLESMPSIQWRNSKKALFRFHGKFLERPTPQRKEIDAFLTQGVNKNHLTRRHFSKIFLRITILLTHIKPALVRGLLPVIKIACYLPLILVFQVGFLYFEHETHNK